MTKEPPELVEQAPAATAPKPKRRRTGKQPPAAARHGEPVTSLATPLGSEPDKSCLRKGGPAVAAKLQTVTWTEPN